MKQAKPSFKLRGLPQKLVSVTLVICLIFGLSAETIAFASKTLLSAEMTETVEYGPDTPTYPDTVISGDEEEVPPRSIEELKSLPGVYMDETGRVTHINRSLSNVTAEEINLLFGIGTPAEDQPAHAGVQSSGMTASDFEAAALLHGGENVFSRELLALNHGIENDSLSTDEYTDIKLLICSGYTYRQARAAIVSADILGVTIETLCQAKVVELTLNDDGAEPTTANGGFSSAATRLGVPYSVVEDYAELYGQANIESIVAVADMAMQTAYSVSAEGNVQMDSGSTEAPAELTATSSETPAVSYAPKRVLSDPFSYKSAGNMDISLATGDFIYSETDLYIPGIAGLDLSITRQYVSAFAYSREPLGESTGLHDNEETLQLVYDLYASYDLTGDGHFFIVSNPTAYTIVDTAANAALQSPIANFKTSEYFAAIAARDYYNLGETATTLWLAYDSEDNPRAVKLVPALKPIGNFDEAFEHFIIDYSYLVDEFGLGHGWRLGFSGIETYFNTLTGTLEERLILSDGRTIGIDENGDLVYSLDDMWLSDSGEGYAGAAYTLHHADGKKEYFNSAGRNIAIVDRYGNEIKIEYVAAGIYVYEMKITDTVGNIVVFKEVPVDLGESTALSLSVPGGTRYYTRMRTLTLNGETVCTYYSYDEPFMSTISETNYLTKLVAVKDSGNQFTLINSTSQASDCNCFVATAATNDFRIPYSALSSIEYPNGLCLEIGYTSANKKDVLGYSGYQESTALSKTGYFYQTENGKVHQNRVLYNIGDFSGYSTIINDYSVFTSIEEIRHGKLLNGTPSFWYSAVSEYSFNHKNQMLSVDNYVYDLNLLEEDVTSITQIVSDKLLSSTTTYTYSNDFPLPSTAATKIYEPGNTDSFMAQNYSYTYDTKGNLLSETLPNGQTITHTYSADYNLPLTTTYKQNADTTIVEQNTLTTDNKSIANTTATSNGATVAKATYTYDAKGRVTAIDSYSSATEYTTQQLTYGNQAQVTQITTSGIKTADGTDAAATPDNTAGTIVEKTTYNARGWPISYTDGNGHVTSVTYDTLGRVTLVSYPDGGTDQYVYDAANNTVTYTDANENVFTYKYDPFGNLIEVYDNDSSQALLSYQYDSLGRKILETIHSTNSAKDQISYYEYDEAGRITIVGMKNSAGTKTPLEAYVYNAALGKATHTIYGSTNAPDSVETVYVDNMGNTIHTGRMLNGTECLDTYTYDYLGNCMAYKSAYTASIGGSYTEKYTYDHAGNLLTTTSALNNTVTNTYDWQGNTTRYTDALGNVTQYTYDKLGRLTKTVSPIDSTKDHTVKYYYDPVGNLTEQLTSTGTTEGNFDAVEYTYDSMNRLTEVTTPLNSTTSYSTAYVYDPMGNVLSARYGNTKVLNSDNTETVTQSPSVTTYTYDRFGNVLTETNALSKTETYTYDLNGNVATKQDRNGVLTQYTYDSRGRLISEAVGSGSAAITRSYTYAPNGLLLSESQGSDTVTYTYDALGRLTDETNGSMHKAYTYNIGDLRTSFKAGTSLTTPLTSSAYTYDALGRLSQASGGDMSAAYTYDANSNLSTTTYGNGLQQVYSYNSGNLVSRIDVLAGTNSVARYSYDYDLSGREIRNMDNYGVTSYAYDALGQLVSEQRTATQGYTNTYAYDSRGNRIGMTEDGVATSYTYDAANRLLSSTTGSADKTYTYDDNGNLLTEVVQLEHEILPPGPVAPIFPLSGDDLQSMVLPGVPRVQNTYNDANQLTETTIGSRHYVYSYYPSGLRKSKEERNTTSGLLISTREYTWNGDQLALEGFEDAVTRYYYGLGLFANDYNYYCSDAHGNVRMLVSDSGILRKKYAYDAFGNEKPAGSSGDAEIMGQDYDLTEGQSAPTIAPNPFRYCGEYYDAETGLYYLRARYYDPTVGRFTQKDTHWNTANMIYGDSAQTLMPQPLAIRQAGNLYAYCANDPVTYVDYSGNSMDIVEVSFDSGLDSSMLVRGAIFGAALLGGSLLLAEVLDVDDPPILYAKKGAKGASNSKSAVALGGTSPASPDPDDDEPNSPNQIKEKWLERNEIDSHEFKQDVIKQLNKEGYNLSNQVSRYDIYKDSSTGRIWLKVKETGRWLPTNETWTSLTQYYSGF